MITILGNWENVKQSESVRAIQSHEDIMIVENIN